MFHGSREGQWETGGEAGGAGGRKVGRGWLYRPAGRLHFLYNAIGLLRKAREPWGSKRFLPWEQLSRSVCLLSSILGDVRNYSSGPAPGPLGQNPWGSLCVVFSTVQPMCSRECSTNTYTRQTLCVFKGVINKHIYTSDTVHSFPSQMWRNCFYLIHCGLYHQPPFNTESHRTT